MNRCLLGGPSRRVTAALAAALCALALAPSESHAQATEADLARARAVIASEPSVRDTVQAALAYFRVRPDDIDGIRSAARARALLPILTAGYVYTDDTDASTETQRMSDPYERAAGRAARQHSVGAGVVFDFRDAIFNPGEVQAYGLIGVQRDVMLEATRAYFLRRQLMLRAMLQPPADPLALLALDLRIEEFTAVLDSLTGGWFSARLAGEDDD